LAIHLLTFVGPAARAMYKAIIAGALLAGIGMDTVRRMCA